MDTKDSMIDPGYETLLDKVDSRFTLVGLAARRARSINGYYIRLRRELGGAATLEQTREFSTSIEQEEDSYTEEVPPQVSSHSAKPLTIAFEEIAADKISWERYDPEQRAREQEAALLAEETAQADFDEESESEAASGELADAQQGAAKGTGRARLTVAAGGRAAADD